jgi:hypothetical protein
LVFGSTAIAVLRRAEFHVYQPFRPYPMNLRLLSITVALLVALSAGVWWARRPTPPTSADPRVGQPVLAANLASQVARVKLSDQGKTVELARAADGSWTVPSYHDFPADFAKLGRLITDLTEAKIRRLVTARPERLARLEFKDTSVGLSDSAGQELWQATLGKNADGGGRYLRYGTETKGYLAGLSLWLDADPKNWADTMLLDLKADTIARLEMSFADGTTLAASRAKKEDPWAPAAPTTEPAGKRLKSDRLNALLTNFAGLRFTDTTAPDDEKALAARAHSRTLKLTTFEQKTYTLTLTRTPEEKKPKLASGASGAEGSSETTARADKPAAPAADATTAKAKEPEFETIPAGPVFISIASSDPSARINGLMQKRAIQIGDWPYTGLPATAAELWEDVPVETKPGEQKPAGIHPDPSPQPVESR